MSGWNSSRPVYYNVNENTFVEYNGVQYVIENGEATAARCVSSEKTVTVADSVKIGNRTYDVTTLGGYAFENCNTVTEIKLSSNLETIESYAITNCSSLKKVVIPDNVEEIQTRGFNSCSKLTIYCSCSSNEARSKWGFNWHSGCDGVTYNYTGN